MSSAILRANPGYELILLERLSASERTLLLEQEGEAADTYGALLPRRGSRLEPRHASVDVALLFLTLSEAGPLPVYVRRRLGEDASRRMAQLVLDNVLEIAQGEGYVGGPAAAACLFHGHGEGGEGHIGELSRTALRYAQTLADLPAPPLAIWLYTYGARPVTPKVTRQVGGESRVRSFLGLDARGQARLALEAAWAEAHHDTRCWITFRARRAVPWPVGSEASWKLYVSPQVEDMPRAIVSVARALRDARGIKAFKVGGEISALCRPDKLVVYFERLEDLQEGAAVLRQDLARCRAQGVPFTAPITSDGLLSWGVDRAGPRPEQSDVSWRRWITERLAEYLVLGRAGRDRAVEPWQFAIDRIGLDGVDPHTWAPLSPVWKERVSSE